MRLLILYRKPFIALEEALLAQGCELIHGDWDAPPPADIDACVLDLCDATRHAFAIWRLRRRLRRAGVPIAGVSRDAPWYKGVKHRRLWLFATLKLLDVYATHSLQPTRYDFGGRTLYFANAAWTSRYNLRGRSLAELRDPAFYRHDVSFLGNIDAVNYPEHAPRVALLDALDAALAPHGLRITRFDSLNLSVEEQVEAIQRSRINLNIGSAADIRGARTWGPAERLYGIPACGGFVLTDARPHAADDFAPGTELVEFHDIPDCAARIGELLGDFERLRDIAEAAHRRVMAEHTYEHRARALIDALRAAGGADA